MVQVNFILANTMIIAKLNYLTLVLNTRVQIWQQEMPFKL
jgi:hypothetical protein